MQNAHRRRARGRQRQKCGYAREAYHQGGASRHQRPPLIAASSKASYVAIRVNGGGDFDNPTNDVEGKEKRCQTSKGAERRQRGSKTTRRVSRVQEKKKEGRENQLSYLQHARFASAPAVVYVWLHVRYEPYAGWPQSADILDHALKNTSYRLDHSAKLAPDTPALKEDL